MNLPNKLTLLRVLLIPVMVVMFYIDYLRNNTIFGSVSIANFIMCMIFVVASLTDFLDGYLARKNNQVTTFGKFADPLADKILVMAALIILTCQNVVPGWIVIVILAREFIVTGIRILAIENGKVIAASKLGKYKTASTMVAIIVLFFHEGKAIWNNPFNTSCAVFMIGSILLYIALALTVISGIDYFMKNKAIIFESIW